MRKKFILFRIFPLINKLVYPVSVYSFYLDSREKWSMEIITKLGAIALITICVHIFIASIIIAVFSKKKLLNRIYLHEIMSKELITISPDETLRDVENLFLKHKIRHLPVITNLRSLQGIITRKDINRLLEKEKNTIVTSVERFLEHFTVEQVMSKTVTTLYPHDTLDKAIRLMGQHRYGCILIINESKLLVGIVTQTNIIEVLSKNI